LRKRAKDTEKTEREGVQGQRWWLLAAAALAMVRLRVRVHFFFGAERLPAAFVFLAFTH